MRGSYARHACAAGPRPPRAFASERTGSEMGGAKLPEELRPQHLARNAAAAREAGLIAAAFEVEAAEYAGSTGLRHSCGEAVEVPRAHGRRLAGEIERDP